MKKILLMLLLVIMFQSHIQCATPIDYSQEYPSLAEGFQLLNIANFNDFAKKYSKNQDIQNQATKKITQMLSRDFFNVISQDIASHHDISPLLEYVIRHENDFLQSNILVIMQQQNKINDLKLQAQQANAQTITSLLKQLLNEEPEQLDQNNTTITAADEQSLNEDAYSEGNDNYNDDEDEYEYQYEDEDDSNQYADSAVNDRHHYDEDAKLKKAIADSLLNEENSAGSSSSQDVSFNFDVSSRARLADQGYTDQLIDNNNAYSGYYDSNYYDESEQLERAIANSLQGEGRSSGSSSSRNADSSI